MPASSAERSATYRARKTERSRNAARLGAEGVLNDPQATAADRIQAANLIDRIDRRQAKADANAAKDMPKLRTPEDEAREKWIAEIHAAEEAFEAWQSQGNCTEWQRDFNAREFESHKRFFADRPNHAADCLTCQGHLKIQRGELKVGTFVYQPKETEPQANRADPDGVTRQIPVQPR